MTNNHRLQIVADIIVAALERVYARHVTGPLYRVHDARGMISVEEVAAAIIKALDTAPLEGRSD